MEEAGLKKDFAKYVIKPQDNANRVVSIIINIPNLVVTAPFVINLISTKTNNEDSRDYKAKSLWKYPIISKFLWT